MDGRRARARSGATILLLVPVLALGGCSTGPETAPDGSASSASTPASIPAGATTLRALGVGNGPQELLFPARLEVTSRIDQPNVVTLTTVVAQQELMATWLATRLPDGWRVDANRNQSLLFSSPAWQGAFTCSETTCALTLRKQAR